MDKITLVLPFIPPTINYYIGRDNRWQYQADKKKLHQAVKMLTIGKNYNINKCKMDITYYFKDRRRHDPGNNEKILLDCLVEANIITDDNYGVITELTTRGSYDKENPRTEVVIEPIKEN
jgi:Holliday junction resolvase RusA-like endonuclease